MAGYNRSKERGHLNVVPQVHVKLFRTEAANYYGSSATLGKSSSKLYNSNFNHADSPVKMTEKDVADAFFSGRKGLVSSTGAGGSIVAADVNNPDFPFGTINYAYHTPASRRKKIRFKGSDESTDMTVAEDKYVTIDTDLSNDMNTGLSDDPGKWTANLNPSGLNFNGTGTAGSQVVPSKGSGGFGNDTHLDGDLATNDISSNDVHNNTISPPATALTAPQIGYKNIRGDSIDNVGGVLPVGARGTLGAYALGAFDGAASSFVLDVSVHSQDSDVDDKTALDANYDGDFTPENVTD